MVGASGSGKTTLARALAAHIRAPLIELDAMMHQAGWVPRPDDEFKREVEHVTGQDAWVMDGNYPQVVMDGPVWQRADTVVWVDPPRRTVMCQLFARILRRAVTREILWNGNREPLSNLTSLGPDQSILVWGWITYGGLRERYAAAMEDPTWRHINFVKLRSKAEANCWLRSISLPA